MANKKSRKHHWWPVGLQRYWCDKRGDVSWIEPNGITRKKRRANRNVAFRLHGHTIHKGNEFWEGNFESEFDIDNEIHRIVASIGNLKPFGRTPAEFITILKQLGKKDRTSSDGCKFYHLDETLHRNLMLLLYSLLIRSPVNRFCYEGYSEMLGLPRDEDVGKANISQNYRIAKDLCENGLISNQYFVLLQSPLKRFIFGDGVLDWLTSSLIAKRTSGRALVPLTPHVCVYFCTPIAMRSTPNCASLSVAPWMVDWVNRITQIYSKDKLFFLGKPPKLIDAFHQREFLEHKKKTDPLIDMLDEIAGIRSRNVLQSRKFIGL